MPAGKPASLSESNYFSILAFDLKANGITLDKSECERTLQHLARLWGYRVRLIEVDSDSGRVLKEHEVLPMP